MTDQVWAKAKEALACKAIDALIDSKSGERARAAKVIGKAAINNFNTFSNDRHVSPQMAVQQFPAHFQ